MLDHLNPFQAMGTGEMGFLWISEILNSRYSGYEQDLMISWVVHLLGKQFYSGGQEPFSDMQSVWIPPLLSYLTRCEKTYAESPSPYSGSIVLGILSNSPGYANFGTTLLPILMSTLSPTHPLQSRSLALQIFHRFVSGWFSSRMETVSNSELEGLLRAVGDPFHSAPDILQDGKLIGTAEYNSMMAAVVLIEFASSDLWRNHLHRSNLASCEEIASTEEGMRAALSCIFDVTKESWPEFLCTPIKIVAAIRRLEELQCPNTAEVVIAWAWITGLGSVADRDGRKSIEDETLRFYQTHGVYRLAALKRHITYADLMFQCVWFFGSRYEGSPFRVGSTRRQALIVREVRWRERWDTEFFVSQACQLRRLYHLFGFDLTTWEEAVRVEDVDEEMEVSSERSVAPDLFVDPLGDWACDYP